MKFPTPTRTKILRPTLRFTPTAWAKLLFLRDLGDTEVGGFGITSPKDLLLVEDFVLVKQVCSTVTVAFEDEAVAEFFDQQIDQGRKPEQFARIWIHTHPGRSAMPSSVDEETFARVFGRSDWAVMAIVACGGQTFARLQFRAGPGGALRLPLEVDFRRSFAASDHEAWTNEYLAAVKPIEFHPYDMGDDPFRQLTSPLTTCCGELSGVVEARPRCVTHRTTEPHPEALPTNSQRHPLVSSPSQIEQPPFSDYTLSLRWTCISQVGNVLPQPPRPPQVKVNVIVEQRGGEDSPTTAACDTVRRVAIKDCGRRDPVRCSGVRGRAE